MLEWGAPTRFKLISGLDVLLFVTVIVVYGIALGNDYGMDDYLVTNGHALTSQGISSIPEIFSSKYYQDTQGYSFGYRPVALASFAIEHQLFGESPLIGHIINLLLYILTICQLYRLLVITLGYDKWVGLLACLIFLVHPIHSEVVVSLKNRDELLVVLFGITSIRVLLGSSQRNLLRMLVFLLLLSLSITSKLTSLFLVIWLPVVFKYVRYYSLPVRSFSYLVLFLVLTFIQDQRHVLVLYSLPSIMLVYFIVSDWFFFGRDITSSLIGGVRDKAVQLVRVVGGNLKRGYLKFRGLIEKTLRWTLQPVVIAAPSYGLRPWQLGSIVLVILVFEQWLVLASLLLVASVAPHMSLSKREYLREIGAPWLLVFSLTTEMTFPLAAVMAAILFGCHFQSKIRSLPLASFLTLSMVWIIGLSVDLYLVSPSSESALSNFLVQFFFSLTLVSAYLVFRNNVHKSAWFYPILCSIGFAAIFVGYQFVQEELILYCFQIVLVLVPMLLIRSQLSFVKLIDKVFGLSVYLLCFWLTFTYKAVAFYWVMTLVFGVAMAVGWSSQTRRRLFVGCLSVALVFGAIEVITNPKWEYLAHERAEFIISKDLDHRFEVLVDQARIKKFHADSTILAKKVQVEELFDFVSEQTMLFGSPDDNGSGYIYEVHKSTLSDQDVSSRPLTAFEAPVVPGAPSIKLGTALVTWKWFMSSLLFPFPLSCYYGYDVVKIRYIMSIQSCIGLLILLSLLIGSAWLMMRGNVRLGGPILFVVSAIIPVLGLVEPMPGVYGDRYAYFGSVGMAVFLSQLLHMGYQKMHLNWLKRVMIFVVGVWIGLMGLYSAKRASLWKNELTLYQYDVKRFPESVQLNYLFARKTMEKTFSEKSTMSTEQLDANLLIAQKHYREAVRIYPYYFNALYDLARVETMLAQYDSAAVRYTNILQMDSTFTPALNELNHLKQQGLIP